MGRVVEILLLILHWLLRLHLRLLLLLLLLFTSTAISLPPLVRADLFWTTLRRRPLACVASPHFAEGPAADAVSNVLRTTDVVSTRSTGLSLV
jgi:hypothetical protein